MRASKWKTILAILILIVVGLSVFFGIRLSKNYRDRILAKGVKLGYALTIKGILNQINSKGYVVINTDNESIVLVEKSVGENE